MVVLVLGDGVFDVWGLEMVIALWCGVLEEALDGAARAAGTEVWLAVVRMVLEDWLIMACRGRDVKSIVAEAWNDWQ